MSGDRYFGDDKSVIAGFGLIDNKSVLIIGQEKGEDLNSRIERNFGMMRPEGYRKCIRLMKLADRFQIPVISFIDTPGAYPGIGAEQRGQASAIANSIECCMSLTVPNISIIIGEGGSGGAIALASSNKVIMLENSIYSVISPEGCASILWRDPSKSLQAAEAMKLTAKDLLKLKIIDEVIPEPLGGAHRDPDMIAEDIKFSIIKNLKNFENYNKDEIYDHRKSKFLQIGRDQGFSKSSNLWHLERIVTGIFLTSVVAKINFKLGGGSSKVFNNPLKACFDNIWTSSIINILYLALVGLYFEFSINSLMSSIPVFEAASISKISM